MSDSLRHTPWASLSRWIRRPPVRYALVVMGVLVVFSAIGGWGPARLHVSLGATPPSFRHPFGTDGLGRDLLGMCMAAGRLAIGVAGISALLSVGLAFLAALPASSSRQGAHHLRNGLGFLADTPLVLLAVAALAVLPGSSAYRVPLVVAVLVFQSWPRLTRRFSEVLLAVKSRPYVEIAQAMGAGSMRILLRHVLPNAARPLIAASVLALVGIAETEAVFAFLGIGVRSWGALLRDGVDAMSVYPWLFFFPVILVCSLGIAGRVLAYHVDPAAGPGQAER